MALEDIVTSNITIQSAGLSLVGFGRALLLVEHTHNGDAFRIYTSAAQMLTDGFSASDQVYKDAVALMQQLPHPKDFMVGKRAAPVAHVVTITPTAANAHAYTLTIDDGTNTFDASYTSDGSGTAAEIVAGLKASIATASPALQLTTSGTDTLILTADREGVPLAVSGLDANLAQAQTTANHGITEDLATLVETAGGNEWRVLLIPERDEGSILVAAGAIEALAGEKFFACQSDDAAILSAAYDEAEPRADIFSRLKSLGYARTMGMYHATDADPNVAAWVGRCIPLTPASLTWKFKTLSGAVVDTLTATQRSNLLSKNGNAYETVAGVGSTFEGKTFSGEFIDIIRGIDKLNQDIERETFLALKTANKVPFTADGIQITVAAIRKALQQAIVDGLIARSRTRSDGKVESPAFSITAPVVSDISSADRATRTIPSDNPISWEATLAGAVHAVNISGTVSA